jgi:hypothetical protein
MLKKTRATSAVASLNRSWFSGTVTSDGPREPDFPELRCPIVAVWQQTEGRPSDLHRYLRQVAVASPGTEDDHTIFSSVCLMCCSVEISAQLPQAESLAIYIWHVVAECNLEFPARRHWARN